MFMLGKSNASSYNSSIASQMVSVTAMSCIGRYPAAPRHWIMFTSILNRASVLVDCRI
jgi:hypothetical protein